MGSLLFISLCGISVLCRIVSLVFPSLCVTSKCRLVNRAMTDLEEFSNEEDEIDRGVG